MIRIGRTDLVVSEVGFGAIPIIRLDLAAAVAVLRHALDRGITFFDTANAYRDSEEKIGAAFSGRRGDIVLATKTYQREGKGAMEQLERSLRMMRTDYLDLYQLHQIARREEWEAVTAPGGALEAVSRAREAGKIRYLGVTSHNLAMALELVRTGLFDTVQVPLNFIEDEAVKEVLPEVRRRQMGFIVMKPFGGGVIDNARVAFAFLRRHEGLLPIPGFESAAQIDEVLSVYEDPKDVGEEDLEVMDRYRRELGEHFCRRCEYCQPCPQGVRITPAMGYPILVSRMSEAVAVEYGKAAMETVPLCTSCGSCVERCPYGLSIPEILRSNYEMYLRHSKGRGSGKE